MAFVTPGQWDKYESASLPLGETQAQDEPSTTVIKRKRGIVRKEQQTMADDQNYLRREAQAFCGSWYDKNVKLFGRPL